MQGFSLRAHHRNGAASGRRTDQLLGRPLRAVGGRRGRRFARAFAAPHRDARGWSGQGLQDSCGVWGDWRRQGAGGGSSRLPPPEPHGAGRPLAGEPVEAQPLLQLAGRRLWAGGAADQDDAAVAAAQAAHADRGDGPQRGGPSLRRQGAAHPRTPLCAGGRRPAAAAALAARRADVPALVRLQPAALLARVLRLPCAGAQLLGLDRQRPRLHEPRDGGRLRRRRPLRLPRLRGVPQDRGA
mmetsp:Transcript_38113/g.113271  ORF Transcript_38113/g.113271 Transcript_38113/m.113271 type:complete len:241 (-) Transcript_38113:769-1491(-)